MYAAPPVIAPYLVGLNGNPPQAIGIAGQILESLWGGGGGSGGYDAADGGAGGAGLQIICRGIHIGTTGSILLSGSNGQSGVGAGGGGGGGTCVILVERAAGGLATTDIVDPAKIITAGGDSGHGSLQGYGVGTFGNYAQSGTSGGLIHTVF